MQTTVDAFGKLDVLVNNAAYQEHVGDFLDLTDEHFDLTLKTNLYGYFYMAKAAVAAMKPGGVIVNTGSITGIEGNKDLLDYSMTKGGIHAFTRSLATHLIDKGIRVNAVAPGPVWTPLNPADKDEEKTSKFGSQTPMGRPASRKRSRRPMCSWPRPSAAVSSPARCCRSSVGTRAGEGERCSPAGGAGAKRLSGTLTLVFRAVGVN